MTNEQLAGFIKQGGAEDLKPVLWERVKKLAFMICDRYYTQYSARFAACGVERCDYRQACYEAFLKALEAFDEASGKKFISFIEYPIKNTGAELLGIRNRDRTNRSPLDNCISLDAPLPGTDPGEGLTLGAVLEDPGSEQPFEEALQRISDEQTRAVLSAALDTLPERERGVVVKEFFEGMTQKEISELYGVSAERVRQLRVSALRHLAAVPKLRLLREEQHTERKLHFSSYAYNAAFFEAQEKIQEILKTGHYLSYGKEQAIIQACLRKQQAELEQNREYYNTACRAALERLTPLQRHLLDRGIYSYRIKPNEEKRLAFQLFDALTGRIILESPL